MSIGTNESFIRFTSMYAHLIDSLCNKRNKIQHICGGLVQIFPALMLQKVSNVKDENYQKLADRLYQWEQGNWDTILQEANQLQENIGKNKNVQRNQATDQKRRFLSDVGRGDIKSAALSVDPNNFGLNQWNDHTKTELKDKFPSNRNDILELPDNSPTFHSTKIEPATIYNIISKSKAKSGGINHLGYVTLFQMCKLKNCGNTLVQTICKLANQLANSKLPHLKHFLASRCIPVRKKDGSSRPVSIGDVLRRVCLRAIDLHHKQTIISNSPRQLSNGVKGGPEAIIHAMRKISSSMKESNIAILTIDATNAYNNIDRAKTLDMVYSKVPELYNAAYNTYGNPSYIALENELWPVEQGTSQGCPLSSSFFNLGISILIDKLSTILDLKQIWYADDGILYGHPDTVLKAWNLVKSFGPSIGYLANTKSTIYHLNEKWNNKWEEAELTYTNDGIEVLGSVIGNKDFISNYCKAKFDNVANIVGNLTRLAKSHPQQSWSVISRSTKFKSSYLFRTIPSAEAYADSYNEKLEEFLSTILGRQLDEKMINQSTLPIGKGGLGLNINANEYAQQQYNDSQMLTYHLTRYITNDEPRELETWKDIYNNIRNGKKKFWDSKLCSFKETIDETHAKRMDEMQQPGANNWLSCLPVSWKHDWQLTKNDFRDAMNLRFNLLPLDTPMTCVSNQCNEPFTLKHIDICPKGGTITRRHDYVKNILARYAEKAYGSAHITVEPHLGELTEEEIEMLSGNTSKGARADIAILDYQNNQTTSYVDVCVISPICDSNKELDISKLIAKTEKKKNDAYALRVKEHLGGNFLPFILTSGGAVGPMAQKVIKQIVLKLSKHSYDNKRMITDELKGDLSMSLVKSRIQGLRCNRNTVSSQLSNLRNSQIV